MASAFALSWESVNSDSLGTGYYFIRFQKKSNFFKRGRKSHRRRELVFWSPGHQGERREISRPLQFEWEIAGALLAAALVSGERRDGHGGCKQSEGWRMGSDGHMDLSPCRTAP